MNQIRLYEVLKPKLGDEESKLLIEYIEGIRREIVTKDILEKTIELAKSEILAELSAKIEEIKAKTERDKAEIFAKTEKDKAEIIKWVIGIILAQTTLLAALFIYLARH